MKKRNIVTLCNVLNHVSNPSICLTDWQHNRRRQVWRMAFNQLQRYYLRGEHYQEFSNGTLWPTEQGMAFSSWSVKNYPVATLTPGGNDR